MKVDKITHTLAEKLADIIINNYKKGAGTFAVTYVYLLRDDTLEITQDRSSLEYLLWDSSLYPTWVANQGQLRYRTHLSKYLYQLLQKRYSESVAYRRKSNQGSERELVKTLLNSVLQHIDGVNRTQFSTGQEQVRGNTYIHIYYQADIINTLVFTSDYIILLQGKTPVTRYFISTDKDERELVGEMIKAFQTYLIEHIEQQLD